MILWTVYLTLTHVGGAEGYCNRSVCLSIGKILANLRTLENTTSRRQIIHVQGSKVTISFC